MLASHPTIDGLLRRRRHPRPLLPGSDSPKADRR